MQKFYIDANGVFLGGFDGCEPEGGIEVETPPTDGRQVYKNGSWCQTLQCCKECKKSEIESSWQAEISDGFKYNGDTFDFDDTTLGIIGARLSYNEASETPTTADLTFYDMDKVAVVFADKAAFKAFAIEFIVDRNTLDQKRIILKAQINACETVEAVQAITW